MNINRPTLTKFRADFENAVKDLEKEYGVKISLGSIKYSDAEFHAKMEVKNTTINAKGEVEDNSFRINAPILGLNPEWQGKIFYDKAGKRMRIAGIDLGRPKNPISLVAVDTGRGYKCPEDYLVRCMKASMGDVIA
jgi:hypothetical protein